MVVMEHGGGGILPPPSGTPFRSLGLTHFAPFPQSQNPLSPRERVGEGLGEGGDEGIKKEEFLPFNPASPSSLRSPLALSFGRRKLKSSFAQVLSLNDDGYDVIPILSGIGNVFKHHAAAICPSLFLTVVGAFSIIKGSDGVGGQNSLHAGRDIHPVRKVSCG